MLNESRPLKVVLLGAECTGKTTLARELAANFNGFYMPEYVRSWLDFSMNSSNPTEKAAEVAYHQVPEIGRGQCLLEDLADKQPGKNLFFFDTSVLMTHLYSLHYFGKCPDWISHQAAMRRYHLLLVLDIDIPWEEDMQRGLPLDREAVQKRLLHFLDTQKRPYELISGPKDNRWKQAKSAVERLIGSDSR